jgi:hypothetical protein
MIPLARIRMAILVNGGRQIVTSCLVAISSRARANMASYTARGSWSTVKRTISSLNLRFSTSAPTLHGRAGPFSPVTQAVAINFAELGRCERERGASVRAKGAHSTEPPSIMRSGPFASLPSYVGAQRAQSCCWCHALCRRVLTKESRTSGTNNERSPPRSFRNPDRSG